MAAYNILEARNKLSRLIADVESGLEVTIMRRGKAVARIVPVGAGSAAVGSGAGLAEWFDTHREGYVVGRSTEEIDVDLRDMREAGV